jgi:hypothetical protein
MSTIASSAPGELPERMLISERDAARLLGGISLKRIRLLCRSHSLPHVLIGQQVMYEPNQLREWIARNRLEALNV